MKRLLYETVFDQVRVQEGKIVGVEMNSPLTIIFFQKNNSASLLSGQTHFSQVTRNIKFGAPFSGAPFSLN